jgi:hypothetical protein
MPIISVFYGIIIRMFGYDNRKHKLPHIHVQYQEHRAVLQIPDGELLEGNLPLNKMKLVIAWMEIHKDELLADWELAVSGESILKIEGLK